MTKSELWQNILRRYPALKDDAYIVKQTAKGLHNVVDVAYHKGFEAGKESSIGVYSALGSMFK